MALLEVVEVALKVFEGEPHVVLFWNSVNSLNIVFYYWSCVLNSNRYEDLITVNNRFFLKDNISYVLFLPKLNFLKKSHISRLEKGLKVGL